jgi:glycine betaine/choline ABC-type transport system substrate-binding protein
VNRKLIRVLLGLVAVLALALTVSACGDDNNDSGGSGSAASTTATTGASTQSATIPSDPSKLSADEKAANAIKPVSGADGTSLTVGSKNFTEQFVLGEIYAQALQAAGYKVKKDLNLGSELVAYKALRQGDVDAYPEYTGTSLTSFFKTKVENVPKDPAQAYQRAKQAYAKAGVTALPPTPFENTYRLAVTKAEAKKLGNPTKISDLQGKSQDLVINGFPECRQRIDCLLGVERGYGLKFKKFLPGENKFQILDNNNAQVAFVFTTDGPLSSGKYVILDDDKSIFPPYNITFTVRDQTAKKLGPAGQKVVTDVQKYMTEPVLQELNARVDIDKDKPEDVAADYLKNFGYTGGTS